jgi:hypothetical protein
MTGSKVQTMATPKAYNALPHACQCTKPVAWYANGHKVFALVMHVTALVWMTLIMAGVLSWWAWLGVGFAWLLALVYAYGGDGKGGAL